MPRVGRREFIGGALAGGLGCLAARGAQGPGAKIEVLLGEPVGTISPDIYGHFVEHLGAVVYDGIWVGERSKVPGTGGIRTAMAEHPRRVRPPVARYPGGCFADSYDWRGGACSPPPASTRATRSRTRGPSGRARRRRRRLAARGSSTASRLRPSPFCS